MHRACSFSVAIAVLACFYQLKADEPARKAAKDAEPPQSTPETGPPETKDLTELWRNNRIVHDLAAFDISSLNSKTMGAWIVARIQPGGLSGGGYYSPRTGLVITAGGQWKLIEVLSGQAPPREGRFQWQEPPPNAFDRSLIMMDMSSVFTNPNVDATVICQFFEKKTGADQFASVTSIPHAWKSFVKPAHEYHVQHADKFAEKDLNELSKLASDEDPFIALVAIRHLLGRSSTPAAADQLVELSRSLPRDRQAVLVLMLLNRNDEKSGEIVSQAIDRAKNTAELSGIALGLHTWSLSHPRQLMHSKLAQKLFNEVREKWRSFDPALPYDWTGALNQLLLDPEVQKASETQTGPAEAARQVIPGNSPGTLFLFAPSHN